MVRLIVKENRLKAHTAKAQRHKAHYARLSERRHLMLQIAERASPQKAAHSLGEQKDCTLQRAAHIAAKQLEREMLAELISLERCRKP